MTSRWSARQHALLDALGVDWPVRPAAGDEAPSATAAENGSPARSSHAAPAPPAVLSMPAAEAGTVVSSSPPPTTQRVPMADLTDLSAVAEAVHACKACGLCEGRRQAVPGVGNANAHWMLVGEGPGEQEDLQGEPFVGRSGQLLDAMLAAVSLTRKPATPDQQVFITNTVKCRPPGNRNPNPDEMAACAPFLHRQLSLVRPRLVMALGRFAAQSLLQTDAPVGSLRGKVHRLADGTAVVVSFHPSYLLRQPGEKARAWEDWCLAAEQVNP